MSNAMINAIAAKTCVGNRYETRRYVYAVRGGADGYELWRVRREDTRNPDAWERVGVIQ